MTDYKQGEQYAKMCLEATGHSVIDRSETEEYWSKDIDLTATKDGRKFEIEVKWDSRISRSKSLFLELITDKQKNKAGWASYTEADYIFYGDAITKIFYVFAAEDMREYLKNFSQEFSERKAIDRDFQGNIRKQSIGAVVPLASFC